MLSVDGPSSHFTQDSNVLSSQATLFKIIFYMLFQNSYQNATSNLGVLFLFCFFALNFPLKCKFRQGKDIVVIAQHLELRWQLRKDVMNEWINKS